MKSDIFFKNFDAAVSSSKTLLVAVIAMALLNVFFGLALIRSKAQVILIPPHLDKQVRIGYAEADSEYYKAWGMYVAELVGNLTPGNSEFVSLSLAKLFAADDYEKVKAAVSDQGELLKQNGVLSFFKAEAVIWEQQTSRVYVTGQRREESSDGTSTDVQQVTYQMEVHIDNEQPVLTQFSVYTGEPKTLAWIADHPDPIADTKSVDAKSPSQQSVSTAAENK